MRDTVSLPVVEPSQSGESRRITRTLADRAAFDDVRREKVALIVTELANNLVQHTKQGELVLSVITRGSILGVEILSIDRGPGVADFRRCLVDGYSTLGTPGNGLGAVARMADEFDAHSVVGQGTVIVARVWALALPPTQPGTNLDVGAVCLPLLGEQECGDAWWMVEPSPGRAMVMLADGLGHGPAAAEASKAAIESLRKGSGPSTTDVLQSAHQALKGTRGAAVAVASIDRIRREVKFAGIGNISATIIGPDARQGLVSHNGTLGVDARKFQEFSHVWPVGALLVMHSDGLTSQWKLERQSPLASKHLALIAGTLYRDYGRARDDVTVVAARDGGAVLG